MADKLSPTGLLLFILFLIFSAKSSEGLELRCQCTTTHSDFIHPKFIANIQYIPEGPHCSTPEVIAEMKTGKEVCLDPEAKWVKAIIQKILSSKNQDDEPDGKHKIQDP
ncbi:interleukin-8-like [Tachyglossus aculeatus]|uniref:interleukin-8-like n=1 Tax=Tachyglossus aculeatus TaxID=9261 RepID=UPI0018F42278|nr:interleukin-8-like [Tachyglossus aculeatus]